MTRIIVQRLRLPWWAVLSSMVGERSVHFMTEQLAVQAKTYAAEVVGALGEDGAGDVEQAIVDAFLAGVVAAKEELRRGL